MLKAPVGPWDDGAHEVVLWGGSVLRRSSSDRGVFM